MDPYHRAPRHRRNGQLEELLQSLSELIAPGGDQRALLSGGPRYPVVFITGVPRSGSTMLLQWLANSGHFRAPTNLVSRFWRAPCVGALVDRMLFESKMDFRGELQGVRMDASVHRYSSNLGKTQGPQNVHEFWYFWRHYLGFGNPPIHSEESRALADVSGFIGQLGALEEVWNQPLVLKAMIASWEIPWLADILPNAVFVDLVRNPVENMASLLAAREEFYGNQTDWYSFHIPGRPDLFSLHPVEQVAAQVRLSRRAIDAGLATLDSNRVIRMELREFLESPAQMWAHLCDGMVDHGLTLGDHHPHPFESRTPSARSKPTAMLTEAWSRAVEGVWDER